MDTDEVLDDASAEVLSIESEEFQDVEAGDFVFEEQPAEEDAAFALPTTAPATPPTVPLSADHLEAQPFEGAIIPAGVPKSARLRAVHAKNVPRNIVVDGSAPVVPI